MTRLGSALAAAALLALAATCLGAEAPAAPPAAAKPGPALAKALATKLDARFRRDSVGEVTEDLWLAAGVVTAFPPGARDLPYFTLEKKGVTAREVLEKLAKRTGLTLELRAGAAVLWRPLDDAKLAALLRTLRGEGFRERDNDRQPRCEAAWALGTSGDARALAAAREAVLDNDRAIAHWARASAFRQWPEPGRRPLCSFVPASEEFKAALRKRHAEAKTERERRDALMDMCMAGDRAAVPIVVAGLEAELAREEHDEPWIWSDCAQHMPAPEFLPGLLAWHKHKAERSDLRHAAVWALRMYESPEVTAAFKNMLSDPFDRVRGGAAHAVRRRRDAVEMLAKIAKQLRADAHYHQRAGTAHTLGAHARRNDLAFEVLKKSKDTYAVHGLARARRPESFALVLAHLATAPKAEEKGQVFRALGQLRGGKCLDALVEGLKQKEDRACRGAVFGLAGLRDARGAEALRRMLKDPRVSISTRAGQALVELRVEDAREIVEAMLADENTETAQAGHQSMKFHLPPEIEPELVGPILAKAASAKRIALYEAMSWHWNPGPYGVPLVLKGLADKEPEVRAKAAKTARRYGDPRLVAPLLALLADPDDAVRLDAAETLRESFLHEPGVEEAIEKLKEAEGEEAF